MGQNSKYTLMVEKTAHKHTRFKIVDCFTHFELHLRIGRYMSKKAALAWVDENASYIDSEIARQQGQRDTLAARLGELRLLGRCIDASDRGLLGLAKREFRAYLDERVPRLANAMGVEYKSIRVNRALTRFGSCSAKNSLNFSLMLAFLPYEEIDYIIVHELAHIRHKNHGANFWALVGEHCDRYKAIDARIKAANMPYLLRYLLAYEGGLGL